ncbi:MAG TPA: FkbM family methyltransferase [Chloroflexi bacterium]|nr:FkbM family methyltransferase [Chloroflexota bacterium]
MISRWWYYLTSIPTLLLNIRHPIRTVAIFLGLPVRLPAEIHLRNGYRFRVRSAMDIWIIKEICLDRDYERHSVPIEDGWTVVDIGAGLGDFYAYAARHNPRGRIYACEPFPGSYDLLIENMRLNGIENVRALPIAVDGCRETMALDVESGEPVRYSVAEEREPDATRALDVRCTTLDRLLDEHGIERCDYLKIDCEGSEYNILMQAAPGTLDRVRHLCIEYHEGVTSCSGDDLVRFLQAQGFDVKQYPSPVHRHLGLISASRK